jgi:hypothetical protein
MCGKHLVLIVVAFALVFAGCNRRSGEEGASGSEETGAEDMAPAPEADVARQGVVQLPLTDEGRARAQAPRTQPVDPRDSTFAAFRVFAIPIYPRDYELGLLGPPAGQDPGATEAYVAARSFLSDLGSGSLDEELLDALHPGARATMQELLGRITEADTMRLGTVTMLSGSEVSVEFRFFGPESGAIGELIVASRDGDWYTSDVQVDYGVRADEIYEPGITRIPPLW